MTPSDATALAAQVRAPADDDGPVFAEPWQAQAFALAVQLHQSGAFTWTEWAAALSDQVRTDPTDDGSRYYEHWLAALETLTKAKGLASAHDLHARRHAWEDAYRHTPHGKPVELGAGESA